MGDGAQRAWLGLVVAGAVLVLPAFGLAGTFDARGGAEEAKAVLSIQGMT
jgi:hypothetical protein